MNRRRRFRNRRPQFSTAGRLEPIALTRGHRPWVKIARNARQLKVAGFTCKAPCRGLRPTAPGGFATEGRSFQLPAASSPTFLGRTHHSWVKIAQNARQLKVAGFVCQAPCGGCDEPPPAVSPHRRPQFPTAGRPGAQRPRPRPPPVGGDRTKRPATRSCGLRLPSPLAGAAMNRPPRFRNRRPQFLTAGRLEAHRPLAAAIVRGWKPHKTPGN